MALKRILFQSIPVHDQDRALDFYTGRMGFEIHTDAPYQEGWRWIFLTIPGAETRLHFAAADDILIRDKPALCLECGNVDAMAAELAAAGVKIVCQPDDAPWAAGVRWMMIKDTEGNSILLESFREGEDG